MYGEGTGRHDGHDAGTPAPECPTEIRNWVYYEDIFTAPDFGKEFPLTCAGTAS